MSKIFKGKYKRLHSKKYIYWKSQLDEWQKSSMTLKVFCEKNGLSIYRFKYWQSRITPEMKQPLNQVSAMGFSEVTLPKALSMIPIELLTPKGYRIILKSQFPQEALREILTVIGELSC